MVTVQTQIPDDLQGRLQAIASARGVSVPEVIEETLRSALMPVPFANEAQALDEFEVLQADVLSDCPWNQ